MKSKSTVFLTGATGLVGSYLLKVLLERGHKVYCLVRTRDNKDVRERVLDALNFWDERLVKKYKTNLIVLDGDITKKNLGLSKKMSDLLKKNIEEIFHCAAVTKVNLPLSKIKIVNIEGTKNVLDLALKFKCLKKLNHISTFAVCGKYKGEFREDSLEVGQQFHTSYERTKFMAEKIVNRYRDKGMWIDIYRLPVVLGESTKGKIPKFEHIYQLISICYLQIFDALPLLNARLFLAPLDYVCFALYILSQKGSMMNRTYHLFPQKPVSAKKIIEIASKIMKFKKPRLVSLEKFNRRGFTFTQRLLLRNNVFSVNLNPEINSDFTNSILKKYHFRFPNVDERLFSCILKYFINNRVALS